MMHRSMMRRTRGSGGPPINIVPGSRNPKNDFDFYKAITDANEMLKRKQQQQHKKESKNRSMDGGCGGGGGAGLIIENSLKNNNKTGHNKCMAINCQSSKQYTNQKLKYFNFPDDPEMCMKWISIIKREDLLKEGFVYLSYECYLCSLHFTDNMFIDKSHNKLLENALPLDAGISIIDVQPDNANANANDDDDDDENENELGKTTIISDDYDDEDDIPLKKISNHKGR